MTELFQRMNDTTEGSPWHEEGSVGIHTNMVVTEYLSRISGDWNKGDVLGALACAFHDTGKPQAVSEHYSEERGNYLRFSGHEIMSARVWEDYIVQNWIELSSLFGLTSKDIYKVAWMIEHHKPWGIKKPDKLNRMRQTITGNNIVIPYINMVFADTTGRITKNKEQQLITAQEFMDLVGIRPTTPLTIVNNNIDNKPELVVLIGASGSGKSSFFATDLLGTAVHSWDDIRQKSYGDDSEEAFRLSCDDPLFKRNCNAEFMKLISSGVDLVVDNVNVSTRRRRFFIDEARKRGYFVKAYLFPAALSTLVDRQLTRTNGRVPASSVTQQYNQTQMPGYLDFDWIGVVESNLPT